MYVEIESSHFNYLYLLEHKLFQARSFHEIPNIMTISFSQGKHIKKISDFILTSMENLIEEGDGAGTLEESNCVMLEFLIFE